MKIKFSLNHGKDMKKELSMGKSIFNKMPSEIFFLLLVALSFFISTWSLLAKLSLSSIPDLGQLCQGIADTISTFFEESNRETHTIERAFFAINHFFANIHLITWMFISILSISLINSDHFSWDYYKKIILRVRKMSRYQQVVK